ncbi:MAG: UvrD-helicase domain-containing protein, partial [Candidatus Coatesbacteria bacterium]|nr:UvrD-helicase domain-containing protein [Candidatus Coatesbacteria bacterium]
MSTKYERILGRLTDSQKKAALSPDNVVLKAAAGSGKTTVLVARFIETFKRHLERRTDRSIADEFASVVAITFTRKAAAELEERIRTYLADALLSVSGTSAAWRVASEAMAQSNIGTIHSFCGAILRRFAVEAGLDPEFAIIDESQSALMRREAVESLFLKGITAEEGTPSVFTAYTRNQGVDLILLILDKIDILRGHFRVFSDGTDVEIAEHIQRALDGVEFTPKKTKGGDYDPIEEASRLRLFARNAASARREYDVRKRALSLMDFDDLQSATLALLSGMNEAELARLRSEFSTIMIDEFQDTDRFQWELARSLSSDDRDEIG